MSALNSFFRLVFCQPQRQPQPAAEPMTGLPDSFATTLHDALRMGGQPNRAKARPARGQSDEAMPQISLVDYDHATDLHTKLRRLDGASGHSNPLYVILVLDDELECDLAALLQRSSLARRLVVVKAGQRLPGLRSLADLALQAPKLGWLHIELGRGVAEEIERLAKTLGRDDLLVVLRPRQVKSERRLM
jgi:hypothetical protein